MPIEQRFDDLDLREEPAIAENAPARNLTFNQLTCVTFYCTSQETCCTSVC